VEKSEDMGYQMPTQEDFVQTQYGQNSILGSMRL
jgi:hypothetical protein